MLKRLFNQAIIKLEFEPDDPILIKSGYTPLTGPDMAFVKTTRNNKEEVFIPGSSIKGMLRSYAEKIFRTINPESACMPHVTNTSLKDSSKKEVEEKFIFCGEIFREKENSKKEIPSFEIYKYSCLACKLFGSTYFIGRLSTSDAYLKENSPVVLEQRDGVGIDRFTGGASSRMKFELEVLTKGTFHTQVSIRNFEIWQLAITLQVISDFLNGFVRIGYGKSRGFGRVKGNITDINIYYFNFSHPKNPESIIYGIGELVDRSERELYGFKENDSFIFNHITKQGDSGLRSEYSIQNDKINKLIKDIAKIYIEEAKNYKKKDF